MELKEKLQKVVDNIEEITDYFYRNQDKNGYDRLVEEIPNIINITNELQKLSKDIENKLVSTLNEAMEALEERDTVLLADILQYELTEQLNELGDTLV